MMTLEATPDSRIEDRGTEPVEKPSSPNGTAPSADPTPRTVAPKREGYDRRGTGHGMLGAGAVASRWRVAFRHIGMRLVSLLPGTRFKSRVVAKLFRVKMGEDVGLAYGVMLDPYDPSMVSFGSNVIVGYETRIFVHAFTLNRQRVRPVKIGNDVMIGGFCVIAPGVTIGDGASIGPGTIVGRDVPAGAIVTGNQMNIRRRNCS